MGPLAVRVNGKTIPVAAEYEIFKASPRYVVDAGRPAAIIELSHFVAQGIHATGSCYTLRIVAQEFGNGEGQPRKIPRSEDAPGDGKHRMQDL